MARSAPWAQQTSERSGALMHARRGPAAGVLPGAPLLSLARTNSHTNTSAGRFWTRTCRATASTSAWPAGASRSGGGAHHAAGLEVRDSSSVRAGRAGAVHPPHAVHPQWALCRLASSEADAVLMLPLSRCPQPLLPVRHCAGGP